MGTAACGGSTSQVVKPVGEDPVPTPTWQMPGDGATIVAESLGGTVAMRVLETGETIALDDGEAVELSQIFSGEGLGRAEAQIVARGQVGVVPNPRVSLGHRLTRTADGRFAVLTAVNECNPGCVSDAWLLGADGWRVRLTGEAKHAVSHVAVTPKGNQVAIGGHGLWLVDVPSGKTKHWDEFTSPTYDAYGVLYLRGVGADDSVYEMGEFGNGVLLFTEPGPPPTDLHGKPVPDAAPIAFAADGKTLVATFVRKGEKVTREIKR
ncbi:MAG: hypothetical protein EP329_04450 [Deltaproteobacteria bacterium]|nr:MAG: hypothetical protein EP329_04450 [Deltaproteobacteria bacterium]